MAKSKSREPARKASFQGSLFADGAEKTAAPKAKTTADSGESAKKSSGKKSSGKPKTQKKRAKKSAYATAESMAKSQREISISEFFAKNRHLLGFDNPRKALLTTVREAVDNALDACEEAGILPEIRVEIEQISDTNYIVAVQDNGPGIVKRQIPNIFGKLLYGSKFHRLRMSRGQQGIGISAAGMYGLLTTGQPVKITSRTRGRGKAHYYELQIDTRKNRPVIMTDEQVDWEPKHGTRVAITLEARYQRGKQSVDEYLRQTAIANPHVAITYVAPDDQIEEYPPAVKELPALPKEVKPHPHGIELGILLKMMQDTRARRIQQFLTQEFSRVSPRMAKEILSKAKIPEQRNPRRLGVDQVKAIYKAIQTTKILAPATNCVVPIGEDQLQAGLEQVVDAGFYTSVTRKPSVYRGNPFIIEAAMAFGKPEPKDEEGKKKPKRKKKSDDDDNEPLARVLRFANRVPLQYQQGACAITRCVSDINWRSYGLSQSRGALPTGNLTVAVHIASVWVPFTSESKEAIASYPEILKDIRLALQECGRKLGRHIKRTNRIKQELKKRSYIQKYIPAIGEALRDILDLDEKQVDAACGELKDVLERSRKL
ncbi:MAG: DNA topoisomerase VI subunit B [Phycisphaerae bacterium]